MAFDKFYLTTAGSNLLSKVQSGTVPTLTFVNGEVGSGDIGATSPESLTSLINKVSDIQVAGAKASSGNATVTLQFTNSGITTAFAWREIGLYANDPTVTPSKILYAYAFTTNPDTIPAYSTSPTEFLFNLISKVGNSTTVTATIDSSLVFLNSTDDLKTNIVTFTEASSLTAPISGDAEATLWGKVRKLFSDFSVAVRGTVLTGLSTTTSAAISATDTVLSALGKLQAQISKAAKFEFTLALTTSNWVGSSAPFTKSVSLGGALNTDKPKIDVILSSNWTTALLEEENWNKIKRIVVSNNLITFYADSIPAINMNLQGEVIR